MDALLDPTLGTGITILLFASLIVALGFEFVNGFHDTANAVATVIYTNTLRPIPAVILSGTCNFIGVFLGGIGVAMGIVHLLPVELLVGSGAGAGIAMVLALLVGALMWNLGTWYLGLPASSSHTLIGAILGVGLANSTLPGHALGDGVNWTKAGEMGLSLLISPVAGFAAAGALYWCVKRYTKNPKLVSPATPGVPPPLFTRSLLVATCSGVSFAHGSNDGQKGVGLIMLILMGLVPAGFALDPALGEGAYRDAGAALGRIDAALVEHGDAAGRDEIAAARGQIAAVLSRIEDRASAADVPRDDRFDVRRGILLADEHVDALLGEGHLGLTAREKSALERDRKTLRRLTEYAPIWVMIAVAFALGVGTTVGWKRIVVTVGEKIGKSHLTYAQGAAAELVAASGIGLSSALGMPVSTTHVLSSGVAGTMVAHGSGVNRETARNILTAWVLTLPASMLLSAVLFRIFLLFA